MPMRTLAQLALLAAAMRVGLRVLQAIRISATCCAVQRYRSSRSQQEHIPHPHCIEKSQAGRWQRNIVRFLSCFPSRLSYSSVSLVQGQAALRHSGQSTTWNFQFICLCPLDGIRNEAIKLFSFAINGSFVTHVYLLCFPSDVTSPRFSWLGVVRKNPDLKKAQLVIPGSGG